MLWQFDIGMVVERELLGVKDAKGGTTDDLFLWLLFCSMIPFLYVHRELIKEKRRRRRRSRGEGRMEGVWEKRITITAEEGTMAEEEKETINLISYELLSLSWE